MHTPFHKRRLYPKRTELGINRPCLPDGLFLTVRYFTTKGVVQSVAGLPIRMVTSKSLRFASSTLKAMFLIKTEGGIGSLDSHETSCRQLYSILQQGSLTALGSQVPTSAHKDHIKVSGGFDLSPCLSNLIHVDY